MSSPVLLTARETSKFEWHTSKAPVIRARCSISHPGLDGALGRCAASAANVSSTPSYTVQTSHSTRRSNTVAQTVTADLRRGCKISSSTNPQSAGRSGHPAAYDFRRLIVYRSHKSDTSAMVRRLVFPRRLTSVPASQPQSSHVPLVATRSNF